MRLILLKSQKFAHQAGFYLLNGRWHKVSQDKPAPKHAPKAAHPHAAGKFNSTPTYTNEEWDSLKLPESNTNSGTFNKQLSQLKAAADAGDVTGILGSSFGVNTYGAKLAIIANHVLGLLGSDHKVTPGQKAGTHAAVQTAPEIEAAQPAPKPVPEKSPEPKVAEPAAKKSGDLSLPEFTEGKQTTGVKAHYEKVAKKIIRAAKAGDLSALSFMVNPEKGNTWQGKTENSKALLALHAQAIEHAQSVNGPAKEVEHPDAAKKAATEAKELAKEGVKPEPKPAPEPTQVQEKSPPKQAEPEPEPAPKPEPKPKAEPKAEPKPAAASGSKLSQIPWDAQLLPDSNKNAKSHNGKVAHIKAMAEAGDVAGLKAFKAGINTYGKQQNLLAQVALAALQEDAPAAAAQSKPEKTETPPPAAKQPETNPPSNEVPTPPKFEDFNTDLVAKAWVKMAKDGKTPELMASLHTLASNAKKSPKSFQTDDGGKLLDFAKDMAKWVSNSAPTPSEGKPELDGTAEKNTPAATGGAPVKPEIDPKYALIASNATKVQDALKLGDAEDLDAIKAVISMSADKESDQWKAVHAYAVAAGEYLADQLGAAANTGPQEGETKEGADGTLVFHNGRWHKQGDKASAEKPAPAGPADVEIPQFSSSNTKNDTLFQKAAVALKAAAAEDGAAGLKKLITNHKTGAVSVYIPGVVKIKQATVTSTSANMAALAKFVDELKASTSKAKKAKPAPKPQPAPAAAAPEPAKAVESMDSWKQVGPQGGSNPGGKFTDADGVEWYCKFPPNEDHAKAEVTAAKLYGALGISAQDAKLVTKDGKIGIASRWQTVKKASPAQLKKTPGVIDGFAADAWLGNWDTVGLEYDNLQVDEKGNAMRVDAGGSLMYRAQGAKKAFGDDVTELDSLRDSAINPQAAAVFGKMTKADITASIAKIAQLPDSTIRIIVNANGPGDKAARKALADTLIARKNDLITKYPKAGKVAKKRLDPTSLPVKEDRLPKLHDFANWNGEGAGLSSQKHLNDANQSVEQEMMDIAKSGNLTKLKEFQFHQVDKSTGEKTGQTAPIAQHPSKHVVQLHSDMVQALDEIANPPQPLKIFQETDVGSLDELEAAFPSKKFGTTVGSVHSNEKLGFWVVLGGAHGASKFKPSKISNFTSAAIEGAYKKFKEASKLAKHFILSVQNSGSYNDLFRDGKEYDGSGNKLSDVAKAALEYATEQPEGTSLYRWQNMSDDMVKKIMGAPDGSIFQATGPMCTSFSPTATNHFGKHRVTFYYAKGAKAVESFGSGKFSGEKEITTLPNSRFVILSKKMVGDDIKGGKERMELEVLMLPPDLGV